LIDRTPTAVLSDRAQDPIVNAPTTLTATAA
jgi:hypothetical protein